MQVLHHAIHLDKVRPEGIQEPLRLEMLTRRAEGDRVVLDDVPDSKAVWHDGSESEQTECGVPAVTRRQGRVAESGVAFVGEEGGDGGGAGVRVLRVGVGTGGGSLLREAVHGIEHSILTVALKAGLGELCVGLAGGSEGLDLVAGSCVRAEALDEGDGSAQPSESVQFHARTRTGTHSGVTLRIASVRP